MNICIYGSASNNIHKEFLSQGEELGRALAKASHTVVFGGGAEGMMGAVVRGAAEFSGKSIGISPTFFKVDGVLYDKCTEFIFTDTMRERKKILEEKSDAFIITPGGIGTYDEFFEILSLRQLNRHNKPIVIYNIRGYYDKLLDLLEFTAKEQFMKDKNRTLYYVAKTPGEALNYIENYRVENLQINEFR